MTEKILFGKIPIEFGYSLFYFEEQKYLNNDSFFKKYKSNKRIGLLLGKKIEKGF